MAWPLCDTGVLQSSLFMVSIAANFAEKETDLVIADHVCGHQKKNIGGGV
jgi:hypothetical protein